MDSAAIAIVCFGVVAAIASLVELRRYLSEMRILSFVENISGKTQASSADFYETVISTNTALKGSIVLDRLSAVRRLKARHCPVVLADLSYITEESAEDSKAHRIAKFCLAALLVIGVGTTFWKLTNTLANVNLSALLDGEPSASGAIIDQLKNGFHGAFGASIAAIASTTGLLFIQICFTEPAKVRFFAAIDHFTQFELLPRFAAEEEASREDKMLLVAQKMDATIGNFESLARQLKATLTTAGRTAGSLDTFTSRFGEMIETFSNAIGSNSQFHTTIARLYESVSAAEGRHKNVLVQLGEGLNAAKEQNALLLANQQLLVDFGTDVSRSQAALISGATQLVEASREAVGKHQEALAKQSAEICSSVLALSRDFEAQAAQGREATAAAQEAAAKDRQQSQQLLNELLVADASLLAAANLLQNTAETNWQASLGLLNNIGDLIAKAQDAAALAQATAAQDREETRRLLGDVDARLTVIETMAAAIDKVGRTLQQSAEPLPNALDTAVRQITDSLAELRSALSPVAPQAANGASQQDESAPAPFFEEKSATIASTDHTPKPLPFPPHGTLRPLVDKRSEALLTEPSSSQPTLTRLGSGAAELEEIRTKVPPQASPSV